MPNFFQWVKAQGDTVEQFVSKRVRGGCSGPAAANTRFQGLAADGAKAAIVKMTEEMYLDSSSPLFGSRLMVFAHDESILEIPEEKAHEAAHRQAEIMVSEMRRFVPDVKVKAEPALMRHWSKSVTTKYDANGRLIPWEQA
jgi:DNA polymerase I-like protein with 3'-5' exonuclease and polymerase domains